MLRYLIAVLMFMFTVGAVSAADVSTPGGKAGSIDVTLYVYAREVLHTAYGKIKANNHLRVWNRDAREMSFLLTTLSDEYQECLLEGQAKRLDDGRYEYRENTCRMVFSFGADDVDVRMTGAGGNYCRSGDLREGHDCGSRTTIDSGAYQKARVIIKTTPVE